MQYQPFLYRLPSPNHTSGMVSSPMNKFVTVGFGLGAFQGIILFNLPTRCSLRRSPTLPLLRWLDLPCTVNKYHYIDICKYVFQPHCGIASPNWSFAALLRPCTLTGYYGDVEVVDFWQLGAALLSHFMWLFLLMWSAISNALLFVLVTDNLEALMPCHIEAHRHNHYESLMAKATEETNYGGCLLCDLQFRCIDTFCIPFGHKFDTSPAILPCIFRMRD